MHFPDIRLVEQTEQKFRRFRVCLKETRRERLKSAPYLKLKLFEIVKGGPFGFFEIQFAAGCNVSNFGYSVLAQMGALFEPPLPPW